MKPRYAQEDHTHSGLTGEAYVNGIWSGARAVPSNSYTSDGITATSGGSSSSVTLTLTGLSALASHVRYGRQSTSSTVANWRGSDFLYNTVRGFRSRFIFGSPTRTNGHIFAGFYAASGSGSGDFGAWASSRAIGITVEKGSNVVYWAWRTDASTYGIVDSGLTWSNGTVWSLDLECDAEATEVRGSVTCSDSQAASYTFPGGEFPDGLSDSSALLSPIFRAQPQTTETTAIHMIAWWCVEPW